MGYTSLEALKSFGGFEEDDEDVLLEALIGSASEIISNHTQRKFEIDDETAVAYSRLNLPQEKLKPQKLILLLALEVQFLILGIWQLPLSLLLLFLVV